MGVDLILLPLYTDGTSGEPFAHDVIHVDLGVYPRDFDGEELMVSINAIEARDVPRGFSCRLARTSDGEHTVYGKRQTDGYGDPLKWLRASDLAALADHPLVTCEPRNKAAFAYVAALPADWPIVLYWN